MSSWSLLTLKWRTNSSYVIFSLFYLILLEWNNESWKYWNNFSLNFNSQLHKIFLVYGFYVNNSNTLLKFYVDSSEMFARLTGVRKLFGRRQGISRCWMLSTPYVLISKPECVEVIWETSDKIYFGAWNREPSRASKA